HPAVRFEHEDHGVGLAASRRALQEVQIPRAKRGGNVPVSGDCSVGYVGTAGDRGDLGRARNGWLIMRVLHHEAESRAAFLDRRGCLWLMLGGLIGSGGGTATARSPQSPAKATQSPANDKAAPAPPLPPDAEPAAVREILDQA